MKTRITRSYNRKIIARLLIAFTILDSCQPRTSKDPFLLDKYVLQHITAFKEASRYIMANFAEYYHGRSMMPALRNYLASRALTINDYHFSISTITDTTISYDNGSYILHNDSIYRYYVLYSEKNIKEEAHTASNNFLRKKIDSNLYYVIYSEYSP